jgi:poly-gamma-glutamate synthesis protein (capsule biosynthesis protein)
MGFNLMSRANNHATDWGVQGMRSTDRLLDEAGIVHAGTGETLAQARSPRIFNTKNGRVSLVATASRFEANSRAIDPLGEIPGRPGVSTLRTTRYAMVSPNQLDQLRQIRDSQPVGSIRASEIKSDEKNNVVTLLGAKYKASTELKDKIDFSFVMNERDRSGLISSIRQGKQISDFEVVSMHTHEPGNYSELPPDFMQTFAHQAIDNGADMFIGHGPHRLRGIEIYKGRPIFYSLANFIFTENNISPITRDQLEKMGVEPGKMTDAEFKE